MAEAFLPLSKLQLKYDGTFLCTEYSYLVFYWTQSSNPVYGIRVNLA